ncbi:MAG: GNAT family N-acetyltransferase, partial [Thermoplasmata archaeon]
MAVVIRRMKVEDLVDVKGVDLLAWSDLMEKSYGVKTRLSPRTDENILSYLHSDPDGAFVAVDELAGVIGSCFSHVWGTTGWVGPLSILPSYQSRGLGKELLRSSLRYLEDQGCVDIGLETMPENATNLGMYLKLGLRPEGLVLVLGKRLEQREVPEEPMGDITVERYS